MTVSARALCLVLILVVSSLTLAAEPASPDVAALLFDMEKVLGAELPCPTGEAQSNSEWAVCVDRWARLKTEELYLPLPANPTRSTASEPREGEASSEPAAHQD